MSGMTEQANEVVITGVGPVTGIGVGHDAFWASLAAGRSNIRPTLLPVDVGRSIELPVAAMPPTSQVPGLASHVGFLASQGCAAYRDLGYTLLAIELALRDAGIEYDRDKNNIGAIQAFEAPGVERTVSKLFELLATPMPSDRPPEAYDLLAQHFYNMQPFLYVHLIGKGLGLRGFSTSVHNACASGAFAIEAAAQRIRAGCADVMVVAGGEAFDSAVRPEWFCRLKLYCLDGRMRPFDAQPSGFCVGEGAAAIVLESGSHAARRGADVYAAYLGGAFAQQGWKQAIPDVRAARLRDVIKDALATTGVPAGDLDLIVPHGASTRLSDGYEAACLAQALDGAASSAIATAFKPHVGHLLAASGVIEVVAALLALKHQAVPATLNTRSGHTCLPVPLATALTDRPVNTLLKLSTGFTGHDAASLFRSV
jgi:3-oxoacyl-[acyl-carrier-protein] synthase II